MLKLLNNHFKRLCAYMLLGDAIRIANNFIGPTDYIAQDLFQSSRSQVADYKHFTSLLLACGKALSIPKFKRLRSRR